MRGADLKRKVVLSSCQNLKLGLRKPQHNRDQLIMFTNKKRR